MRDRRGKEIRRQGSSELLLIVNEIKGLKGLRGIETGTAGATGGGKVGIMPQLSFQQL